MPIPPLSPLLVNNCWISDDEEKVELYANHLQEVFSLHDMHTLPLPALEQQQSHHFSFSLRSVAYVLDHLNVKKAQGADHITSHMLQELPRSGMLWLTRIFNAVLLLGSFPLAWKSAKVIMLLKTGKPPTPLSSYHPISLSSVLSKAFEKLLYRKLLELFPSSALPGYQFGFRAQHSTTDQFQQITSKILTSLQQKEYCATAFLDMAQAFDKSLA